MNIKQTISNAAVAFLAQGISMLLSVLQSLFIPKLLGLEEYGYWQLFIFYVGYVGFFHFGLNDGVYLIKGGESRAEIDKCSVKSQFVISLIVESLIAIAMSAVCILWRVEPERQFVIVNTSVYLVVQNAASYLMYVLQAMNETKLSSYSTIVARFSFFLPLSLLLVLRVDSFHPLVVAYTGSALLQLMYCAWHCRDILTSEFESWSVAVREVFASVSVGSKLMLANIASQLILGVLRFAVDARWGVEAFGKLSLSLSLVNFFLAFVTQAAMVLFPALRQSSEEEVRNFYKMTRDTLGVLFPSIYLLYFPIVLLLNIWLPVYSDSLHYFAWLIPICVFDSKMNITCTTLFKVRRQERLLLRINVATTVFCAAMVLASVYIVGSVDLAIASTTVAIIGRSIYSERVVSKSHEVSTDGVSVAEVLLTIAFIVLAQAAAPMLAIAIYAAMYILFLYVYRKHVRRFLHLVRG